MIAVGNSVSTGVKHGGLFFNPARDAFRLPVTAKTDYCA
jgi:hypothetical protein